MSLKRNIIAGFILYWVCELYKYRRRVLPSMEKFSFPDIKG